VRGLLVHATLCALWDAWAAGEMLPEAPRATGMAIAAAVNWIFTCVVGLCFGPVEDALGAYSFLPFVAALGVTSACTCGGGGGVLLTPLTSLPPTIGAAAFTLLYVPETRGRTPAEVMGFFHAGGYASLNPADGAGAGKAAGSVNSRPPHV
jgi:hypothetical protein